MADDYSQIFVAQSRTTAGPNPSVGIVREFIQRLYSPANTNDEISNEMQALASTLLIFAVALMLFGSMARWSARARKPPQTVNSHVSIAPTFAEGEQPRITWYKWSGGLMLIAGIAIIFVGIAKCSLADALADESVAAVDAIQDPEGLDAESTKWRIADEVHYGRTQRETVGVIFVAVGALLGLFGFVVHRRGVVLEARMIIQLKRELAMLAQISRTG
ncbi:MAG TPA: hypothetical protein VE988_16785 [Gemmataceae bacterium]|nr:hypothetical protein [Gemmataceae bacterium]